MAENGQEVGFEELGLNAQLLRAIAKRGLRNPTPIQLKGIPLILEGKDVVARAKTGSGKTLAYLLPMVHKLLAQNDKAGCLSAVVLVPTRELCQQVHEEVESILKFCGATLRSVQLTTSMPSSILKAAISRRPNIVISTPGCFSSCIADGAIRAASLSESLATLVLDEADLLLSYGYEEDIQKLAQHIPRRCQCLLMSATTSEDVEKLKKLVLHNSVTLTLTEEEGSSKASVVPGTVQQFSIFCEPHDKLLYVLCILRFDLIQKKALIFVNSIDAGFKLKLFLEQFGINSAVLNAELPQNSRLHILKEFNAGKFDYLIATDDGKSTAEKKAVNKKKLRKKLMDAEFGVVRGIDFKSVFTVVNFDMPRTVSGYVHRIGRTGRAGNTGVAVSFVCEENEELLASIEEFLSSDVDDEKHIKPFPTLNAAAVDSLRYRAEDVERSVTKIAIREARAKELKLEILNSDKLKAHFEDNPADLKLLNHDKILSKHQPASHLRSVPQYLRDPEVEAAGKAIRDAKQAMGFRKPVNYALRKKRKREQDPLKMIGKQKPGRKRAESNKSPHKGAHSSSRSLKRRKS